jgi:hypothetical protein
VKIEDAGVIYTCDLFDRGADADQRYYIRPPTRRVDAASGPEYEQLVNFSTPRKATSWQKRAQEALRVYLAEFVNKNRN